MTFTETLAARRIYELERQLRERNYAKDHSFEEWLWYQGHEADDGNESRRFGCQ